MDVEEMRRRIAEAPVGRLATIDPLGRPHVVPISFALHDDTLYSAVDAKPKRTARLARLENIRRNPRAAVIVDHYEDDWSKLWWVRLRGSARVLEDGLERDRALDLLEAKYPQYREGRPGGPVVAVDIEEWRGWSAR